MPAGIVLDGFMNGSILRWIATLLVIGTALVLCFMQYRAYFQNPWTRDGLVQAQVVEIASRVSGPITAVHVIDNQRVQAGDPLFDIDERTYRLALTQAEALLEQQEALTRTIRTTTARDISLQSDAPGAVSQNTLTVATNQLTAAEAGVRAAQAQLDAARLNLSFTRVVAPVNGYITNLTLQPGEMAVAYAPLVALINADSFRIDAFFRETMIRDFQPGDEALITLMSYPDTPIRGVVLGIGWGIAQQNGSTGEKLLPNVSPTFEWIRLAQRIPVRIGLRDLPAGVHLRMGTTASVLVRVAPKDTEGALAPVFPVQPTTKVDEVRIPQNG